MGKTENIKTCKRCNRLSSGNSICQSCKTELLQSFEATSDWHLAFEIERAQLSAAKYYYNNKEDLEFL
jgi:RNA polymerase subunit RPABC4/transcription elongation factor Spt4